MLRPLHLKLVKNLLLLVIEFGDASQPDLSSFDRRQYDVDTADLRQPFQRFAPANTLSHSASADA